MSPEEAEEQWHIHGNEILANDAEYQAAQAEQRNVGRKVGWAYVVLVGSLLVFMTGFYLWRFRFFWAIVFYIVMWTLAALAARVIAKYSVKDDHLGELISKAKQRYIAEIMSGD